MEQYYNGDEKMLKDIDENIIYEYSNMSISSNLLIEEKIFNKVIFPNPYMILKIKILGMYQNFQNLVNIILIHL